MLRTPKNSIHPPQHQNIPGIGGLRVERRPLINFALESYNLNLS